MYTNKILGALLTITGISGISYAMVVLAFSAGNKQIVSASVVFSLLSLSYSIIGIKLLQMKLGVLNEV